jgi:heterodisulfide reductase subunit A
MKKKIGVYICHCGSNISDYVDVNKLKSEAEKIEQVVLAKTTMFACADSTQKEIVQDIKERKLDAIVVASCSPKLHLHTFRNVALRAGLNPYNYVQVNVREQCSWAHSNNPADATIKGIRLVKAGIAKAIQSEALTSKKISALNVIAVVGAGVTGMRAAIELADMGSEVYLIEKSHFVGGRVSQWGRLFTTEETGAEIVSRMYDKIKKHPNITLFAGAEVIANSGSVGNFELEVKIQPRYIKPDISVDEENLQKAIDICPVEVADEFNFNLTKRKAIYKNHSGQFPAKPVIDAENCTWCGDCLKFCDNIDLDQKAETIKIKVGAFLISTGFDPYEPVTGEFGYKAIDNVITLPQFKRLIELNEDKLIYNHKEIHNIAYIYCVGSRQIDGENKYCSRYCCTSVIHTANMVKEKYRDINNFHFNRGIRTYGKQELLYNKSCSNGDIYLQSFEDSPPIVSKNGSGTIVKIKDILTANRELEVNADLVVLVTGMVSRKDNEIGGVLKIPVGRDHFFNEIHLKLRPVETVIDGVHIAGACQAPVNITETMKSSLSAAAKSNSLVSSGEIELDPTVAKIDEDLCEWCDLCSAACPFGAISKIKVNGTDKAVVNESICKGCGMCLPVCPENAIDLIGFTDLEIESMIDALAAEELAEAQLVK